MTRAILTSMLARRVVPVVLALAIAFAPAAIEACQVACAIQEVAASASGHGHHHAAAATPEHHQAGAGTMGNAHADATDRLTPDTRTTPPGHSCHDPVPVAYSASASVTAGLHACAHLDGLPVTAGAVAQITLQAPAIVTTVLGMAPPIQRTTTWATPVSERDSVPIALNLPLRV